MSSKLLESDLMKRAICWQFHLGDIAGDGVIEFEFVMQNGIGEGDSGKDLGDGANFKERVRLNRRAILAEITDRPKLRFPIGQSTNNGSFLFELKGFCE